MHELAVRRIKDSYHASVTEKKSREKRAVHVDKSYPQERGEPLNFTAYLLERDQSDFYLCLNICYT